MIKDIARSLSGIALAAIALSISACTAGSVTMDGMKGVPLADLDLSGAPPEEIALLGPDTINIVEGARLAIHVEGDQAIKDHLRFVLHDGKLAIGRQNWSLGESSGIATIEVTVPGARRLTLAGSGNMHAATLRADKARITIAGSGKVDVPVVETDDLNVELAGSGDFKAGGMAKSLRLSLAGSGSADMAGLKVESAKIDVAGSGSANFASDGQITANIIGSGEVRVKGRAQCKLTSIGAGKLICEP